MGTWVVWLDYNDKWHTSEQGFIKDPLLDEGARQFAKALAGLKEGTADFIGTAKASYCLHAPKRYIALKMAKRVHKARLLSQAQNSGGGIARHQIGEKTS